MKGPAGSQAGGERAAAPKSAHIGYSLRFTSVVSALPT